MPLTHRAALAAALATALAVPAAAGVAGSAHAAAPPAKYLLPAGSLPTTSPYDGPWDRTAGGAALAAPTANCLEPKLPAAATAYRSFVGKKGARAVEHVVRAPDVAAAEKLSKALFRRLVKVGGDHGDCYAIWTVNAARNKGVKVLFYRIVDVKDELTVVIASGPVPGQTRPLTRAWAIGRDGRRVAVLEIDHRRASTHVATLRTVAPVAAAAVKRLAG